jgi:GNAT superfamily N-acetyltransferase
MWAPIEDAGLDAPVPDGVGLDEAPGWRTVGDINDAAYGLPRDHLSMTMWEADPARCFRAVAVVEGRAAACAVVNPVGEDAHVILVATLADFRGRGLATACIRSGLRRAREAGATTTTLEATGLGRPAYERMGYRALGPLGMWERRKP